MKVVCFFSQFTNSNDYGENLCLNLNLINCRQLKKKSRKTQIQPPKASACSKGQLKMINTMIHPTKQSVLLLNNCCPKHTWKVNASVAGRSVFLISSHLGIGTRDSSIFMPMQFTRSCALTKSDFVFCTFVKSQ